jgi:hypothetical protein
VRDILRLRGSQRLGHGIELVFQRILLVAQIAHFASQLVVLPLQSLQLGQDLVQLIEPLEDLIAAFCLFFGDGR